MGDEVGGKITRAKDDLEPVPLRGGNKPLAGRVAVIVPTLNEGESITSVIGALPRDAVERIIIVDGGSTDDTIEKAQNSGAELIQVRPGYGRACLAGAQAAEDCDILVFLDGDGADDLTALTHMVAAIRSGVYDFVIGSRARGEREKGSIAYHQIVAGLVAGVLIRLLYGVRYTDMSALRAIRRQTLLALGMRELTYGWNLEMQMRVARARLRVLELPVSYRRRSGGQSKVAGSLRGSLRAGLRIVATFARVALEPARERGDSASAG